MSVIQRLADFLERLSEETLDEIDVLYATDLEFQDPINKASSREHLKRIEQDLFKQLNDVSFQVSSTQEGEHEGVVVWVMHYKFRIWSRSINGISHVRWNEKDEIIFQQDYWDASFGVYGEFPPLGWIMKVIKRFVSVRA